MMREPILTKNTALLRAEVAAHIEADALTRGAYWDGRRGCFIGCLTHSNDTLIAQDRFGIPEPVMCIVEVISDELPDADGRAFFSAFPDAVERDGKDLSRVHWAFLAAELRALPSVAPDVQAVIDPVISGMDILAAGGDWPASSATRAAGEFSKCGGSAIVALEAACAALDLERAAAAEDAGDKDRATWARDDSAASCARVAYCAVEAVANSAGATLSDETDDDAMIYAADDAAAHAARIRQRDTLLRLIGEAK